MALEWVRALAMGPVRGHEAVRTRWEGASLWPVVGMIAMRQRTSDGISNIAKINPHTIHECEDTHNDVAHESNQRACITSEHHCDGLLAVCDNHTLSLNGR